MSKYDFIKDFLKEAEDTKLKRVLRAINPVSARESEFEGRRFLNFSSNNYMALSEHPELRNESVRWVEKYGSGSGASRLITGTSAACLRLEDEIARWKGTEASIVIGSGYLANSGIIPALADRSAVIFADKLNHASLNAGCQLSGAEFLRYRHNDVDHLVSFLEKHKDNPRKLIVSDTVFSMDGDIAPLDDIKRLAKEYDALLYLDDAHASGVFGEHGEGLSDGADIAMGTFSKALGSYGAYAACSSLMKDYLINRCGTFIYSTALPPAVLGSIAAAVSLVQTPACNEARKNLYEKFTYLRTSLEKAGFDTANSRTPVIPVIIGDSGEVIKLSSKLFEKGILALPVRPPTVPKNTARIRISVNAAHTYEDIDRLIDALKKA